MRTAFLRIALAACVQACANPSADDTFYPHEERSPASAPVDRCAEVTCAPPEACRADGQCDPETGECVYADLADGTACDDGNACTHSDRCQAGRCAGGGEVVCRVQESCRLAGTCDPASGCSYPLAPDGSACSDGDACTQGDRCAAGGCVGEALDCTPPGDCWESGSCNAGTGECVFVPRPAGTNCSPATGGKCSVGACDGAGGCAITPVVCEALDDCHRPGVCDPATGLCSQPVQDDGTICDDGNACTSASACRGGTCVGQTDVVCGALACQRAVGCDATAGCQYEALPDGTGCENENRCTASDICVSGVCQDGPAVVCLASGPCQRPGACDPFTGACSEVPLEDGTACSDGDACTEQTTCTAGLCGGGEPVVCASDNPCEVALACAPDRGCTTQPAPDGTLCVSDNPCVEAAQCTGGVCLPVREVVCAALDSCHRPGVCDPTTGLCSHPLAPDGSACDDQDLCTTDDVCTAGLCGGIPLSCDGGCLTNARCDPGEGRCVGDIAPDGTACDDGQLCTATASCAAGRCVADTQVTCRAADACHAAGTCDPVSGVCTQPVVGAPPPCSGDLCFSDVAAQTNIAWAPFSTGDPFRVTGGLSDLDGDGDQDLVLGGPFMGLRLYENRFPALFSLTFSHPSVPNVTGVTGGDYDNDGDQDLLLMRVGPVVLLRQTAPGRFEDATVQAGLTGTTLVTAAHFSDLDRDGHLDLYLGQFPSSTGAPAGDMVFRNRGDGTFENATAVAGTVGSGAAMAVMAADYDSDGYADLFICNDASEGTQGSLVLRNQGQPQAGMAGRFLPLLGTPAVEARCFGVAQGDYDNDGDLDIYWTTAGRNHLWETSSSMAGMGSVFTDVAAARGTEVAADACSAGGLASWGAGLADFDADGDLDVYVANGGGVFGLAALEANAPNALLRNESLAAFARQGLSAGVGDTRLGRAVAFGDFDDDLDVDILQVNERGSPQLYQNSASATARSVGLQLRGTASNRDGIGARLLLTTPAFQRVHEVGVGAGSNALSGRRVLVGLGASSALELQVAWPSGREQHLFAIPGGSLLDVVEPALTIVSVTGVPASVTSGAPFTATLTLSSPAAPGDFDLRVLDGAGGTLAAVLEPVTVVGTTATLSIAVSSPSSATSPTSGLMILGVRSAQGARDESAQAISVTSSASPAGP